MQSVHVGAGSAAACPLDHGVGLEAARIFKNRYIKEAKESFLSTFIIERSTQQIFFKLFDLTSLAVTQFQEVFQGSFFKGLDNKILGFVYIQ